MVDEAPQSVSDADECPSIMQVHVFKLDIAAHSSATVNIIIR